MARRRFVVHLSVAGRQSINTLRLQFPAVALETILDSRSVIEQLNPQSHCCLPWGQSVVSRSELQRLVRTYIFWTTPNAQHNLCRSFQLHNRINRSLIEVRKFSSERVAQQPHLARTRSSNLGVPRAA